LTFTNVAYLELSGHGNAVESDAQLQPDRPITTSPGSLLNHDQRHHLDELP
jgi:hypothetical protein